MKLNELVRSVEMAFIRRSPEILTGVGIAGMITATCCAVRVTPKAIELLTEAEENVKESEDREITPIEVVQATWKCYIPSAIMVAGSVACIIGASSINAKRNAALMAAYKMTESMLTEYSSKVLETVGDKKEKLIRDEIKKDRMKNDSVKTKEVIFTNNGSSLFYDIYSGRYFHSDLESVRRSINELNARLMREGSISLNELYESLSLGTTKTGSLMGWKMGNGLIDVTYDTFIADNGEPCITMDYNVLPDYGYNMYR